MSEKTHEPTEHKLREARRKGQLPRSKLLNASFVTAGALLGAAVASASVARELMAWLLALLRVEQLASPHRALAHGLELLALGALPVMFGATLGALVPAVATAGIHIHPEAITPSLEKIDPLAGLKRLVSPKQVLDVGKSVLAAAIIIGFTVNAALKLSPLVIRLVASGGSSTVSAVVSLAAPVITKAAALLVVLGLGDALLARRSHQKQLMMTREEVKQEHKNAEGDPHHKAKRKAEHHKLAQGGPARGVKSATAVVVNPTHVAVALRYDETECEAPYIVARGREADALAIREGARAAGIPIVRDIPLARSLVHYDVGEEVPEELYQAAAAVLRVALASSPSPAVLSRRPS